MTAARYLEPVPGMDFDMVQLATEMHALRPYFDGDIAAITDDPNGSVEAGLPPGEERVGVVNVGGETADVIFSRVKDPQFGDIWLVSRQTVERIPELYARLNSETPPILDRVMPTALTTRSFLGLSFAQWLGWLLSIPLSMLAAWLVSLFIAAPRRIWQRLRQVPVNTIWESPLGTPLRCVIAIAIHSDLVYWLRPPLLYRYYYFRLMAALLVGCVAWLVSRIVDSGYNRAVNRTRTQRAGGESILIVMQRLTRIAMLSIAVLAGLALFGINVRTTLAGLGIGGLALALAAQKTFENIFGGVSLLMDKAVQVGDFCEIGGKLGTVEDIGLRSLKLRTLDQNLLVVPNGALAQMQFQNMKSRPKLLLNQTFLLRIETQIEQLKRILDGIQRYLDEHPSVESGSSRIRVNTFAKAAFELELWAYVKTGDWAKFTGIRQSIILDLAQIVEEAGARFAAPTCLTYLSTAADDALEKVKVAASSD
ncbi:MAG TPA: mechanosensitive ion channel family protein [Candidatus Sulfotelmatobacter sp.]|nr:mechanosensitive ion channel family protein [Candidatus Sulfotelmatobacter sp.]